MRMSLQRVFLALGGCVLLLAGGCKQHAAEEAAKVPPPARIRVVVMAVQPATWQHEVAGTVEAVRRATIAAKVAGTIEKMPVVLGSAVKKGALLVRINAGEIAAREAQAAAQLAQAKRNFERETRLLAKEAATREAVKSTEDAYRVAEAEYRAARSMFDYTMITAPFDGLVSQKTANAGDLAMPGMPLLVVEDVRQLQVVAAVPEALVATIKPGDKLPLSVPAATLQTTGVVAEIGPAADAASRSATVKLRIAGTAGLRPGQYVRLTLSGTVAAETLLVPAAAVIRFGQMERLFVVQDAKARLRLVRTGGRHGDQVEILAGLNPGEQVVVQGGEPLVDGQPVHVVP